MSTSSKINTISNMANTTNINSVKDTINNVSNKIVDFAKKLSDLDENAKFIFIIIIIIVIICITLWYYLYSKTLQSREQNYLTNIFKGKNGSVLNTHILSVDFNLIDYQYDLKDYYIKTAFNCCSLGTYATNYVDNGNFPLLTTIIGQGVRCLDFQIFSKNNQPIISTTTLSTNNLKQTYNDALFSEAMYIISTIAFSQSYAPNYKDPLFINLRIQSQNPEMYTNLAGIFEKYDNILLGNKYSYNNHNIFIGTDPLSSFQGKIGIFVDFNNLSVIMDNDPQNKIFEYINCITNLTSLFSMQTYTDIANENNDDVIETNKFNITMVTPNSGINPSNPNGAYARSIGCQFVAMRYDKFDNYLEENELFFDQNNSAFVLKPRSLRYEKEYVAVPEPNPKQSLQIYTQQLPGQGVNSITQ
jgi:hypothetical protein